VETQIKRIPLYYAVECSSMTTFWWFPWVRQCIRSNRDETMLRVVRAWLHSTPLDKLPHGSLHKRLCGWRGLTTSRLGIKPPTSITLFTTLNSFVLLSFLLSTFEKLRFKRITLSITCGFFIRTRRYACATGQRCVQIVSPYSCYCSVRDDLTIPRSCSRFSFPSIPRVVCFPLPTCLQAPARHIPRHIAMLLARTILTTP